MLTEKEPCLFLLMQVRVLQVQLHY